MKNKLAFFGFVALVALLAGYLMYGEGEISSSSALGPTLARQAQDVAHAEREGLAPVVLARPREVRNLLQSEVSPDVETGGDSTEFESNLPEFEPLSLMDVAALENSFEGLHAQSTREELFEALERSYSLLPMEALKKAHAAKLDSGDYVVVSDDPVTTADGGVNHNLSGKALMGVPGLTMIHGGGGGGIRQTQITPADFPDLEGELIYLRWLSSKLRSQ